MGGQPAKHYLLVAGGSYQIEVKTHRLKISFFVNNNYASLNQRERWNVMTEVENEHFSILQNECSREYQVKYRYSKPPTDFPDGTWCHKYYHAKRVLQPGA